MYTLFANLKIGKKIGLGFGLMITIMSGMALYAISGSGKMRGLATGVIDVRTPTAIQSMTVLNGVNHALAALRGWMLLEKESFKTERNDAWVKEIDSSMEQLKALSANWIITKNIETLKLIENKLAEFRKYQQEAEDLTQTNFKTAKLILGEKAAPTGLAIKTLLTEMVDSQKALLKSKGTEVTSLAESMNKTLWVLLFTGIGISSIAGFSIARSTSKPVENIVVTAKEILDGNLRSNKLDVSSTDEIGVLGSVFNKLTNELQSFIHHAERILKGEKFDEGFSLKGEFNEALCKMLKQSTEKQKADAETAKVRSMVENMPTNMLLANKDFVLEYLNPSAISTFKKLEKYLPVKVENLTGQSIDIFHKSPDTIRKIVSDPRNLPHTALISVGPEMMELTVAALYDQNQNYAGPMVAWSIVTEKFANEQLAKSMTERELATAKDLQEKVDAMLNIVEAGVKGDLTHEIMINGDGAIEKMGTGLNHFFKGLRNNIIGIGNMSKTLAVSAEKMFTVTQQISGNASETSAQAGAVSAASQQVSQNVQTVATGIEEMTASIKEIAKNAGEAAKITSSAVTIAQNANTTINKLGISSNEIGEVIKIINSIAEKTNLLALNATIEAARAGEAGKGFAVVAGEVKELAKATSSATENISNKIMGIQDDTRNAVTAIGDITNIINQVSDISGSIASAVEEQTATTAEIGRNVTEAARAVEEITKSITSVAKAANNTSAEVEHSQKTSNDLTSMASSLEQVVGQFKC